VRSLTPLECQAPHDLHVHARAHTQKYNSSRRLSDSPAVINHFHEAAPSCDLSREPHDPNDAPIYITKAAPTMLSASAKLRGGRSLAVDGEIYDRARHD